MIIVSARKDFDHPDQTSNEGHRVRDIDLNADKRVGELSIEDLRKAVDGKNVLMLVHGYNNEQLEVYDAYEIIEKRIQETMPGAYDLVLGYSWPGGDWFGEWWQAKSKANAVARMFRFLIQDLARLKGTVDVMSHSLGAQVCFEALANSPVENSVRNYYCTAPAVDNESLEPGEQFNEALPSCDRLFVFHSARDEVLRVAYQLAEWDRALGLYGPEDTDYISRKARKVYVANCKHRVCDHGGYKRSQAMYDYIKAYQQKSPPKFKTL